MKLTSIKFIAALLCLIAVPLQAQELAVFGGVLSHTVLGGKIESTGTKAGMGGLVRFEVSNLGEIDVHAYSDRRWTEANILKPFYIMGKPTQSDVTADYTVKSRMVSRWRLTSSLGVGYFSHNTREKTFSLPVLVTGLNLKNINALYYLVTERFSVVGIADLNYAMSSSTQNFMVGGYAGIAYEF